jgi:hypothetical protein
MGRGWTGANMGGRLTAFAVGWWGCAAVREGTKNAKEGAA